MANKQITAGSTSTDTCKLEDIVSGIEHLIPKKLAKEFETATEDARDFIFSDICEYLNDIAPDNLMFGAHEGDGADFGFWYIEDGC